MENDLRMTNAIPPRDWSVFFCSVFFVLGFSAVFSVLGVLLQTVLSHVSYAVEAWLGRIGGAIIILFGLFLIGLIQPAFLLRERKVLVKRKFRSAYLTSFVFGAAFAVGWTPCVGAALGAILALAVTAPTGAFLLLFLYTLGLGVPFLLVGLFARQAEGMIQRAGPWLRYFEYFFGVVLIALGIFVFTGTLSKIANLEFLTLALASLNATVSFGGGIQGLSIVNLSVAFLAGLGSFLSPCVLPIIPGFLSYLASTAVAKKI